MKNNYEVNMEVNGQVRCESFLACRWADVIKAIHRKYPPADHTTIILGWRIAGRGLLPGENV